MLELCPQGAHIARKRGVYHYRRRLPEPLGGELSLSLATRRYREAEHRAALLDAVFGTAWRRATAMAVIAADIKRIVREYLKEALEADLQQRLTRRPGAPAYALGAGDLDSDPIDQDLEVIDHLLGDAREALARGDLRIVGDTTDRLMREKGVAEEHRAALALGLLEANVRSLEEMRKRALGKTWFVLSDEPTPQHTSSPAATSEGPQAGRIEAEAAAAPAFNDLVPGFVEWRRQSGVREHTIRQDRPTLRFFAEIVGDKAITAYTRANIALFLATMRRFPSTYGRSPGDKDRTASEIIARAEAGNLPRVAAKTVKRHLNVLSRFFKFCFDKGLIKKAGHDELVADHEFAKAAAPAKAQRDAWTSEELTALFASPVWTGCHPTFRTQPGATIIRDSKFWIPLLALFQGTRLEEVADLYRRDIEERDGLWVMKITEEARGLKNANAARVVPLHPELIRLGFLQYVAEVAKADSDPLFPDLAPQGPDRKRGPRFTRWFGHYRRQINLYRNGVGTHAFRHTANTRLRDAISGFQQERHVTHLLGHAQGGGEGRERYDKGPDLRDVAATLQLRPYPEIDLSHLYPAPDGTLPE